MPASVARCATLPGAGRTCDQLTPIWPLVAAYLCNRARGPPLDGVIMRPVRAVGSYLGANGAVTASRPSTAAAL